MDIIFPDIEQASQSDGSVCDNLVTVDPVIDCLLNLWSFEFDCNSLSFILLGPVDSMRQTKALASSVIFLLLLFFVGESAKYLSKDFNHGHCLSYKLFLATALSIIL